MSMRTFLATVMGLIFISPVSVSAKAAPMVFDHLNVQDGLSQNTVLDVMQDSQGYMWIATEAGLNRFDGYTFVRYNQDRSDPHALSSDFVWDMAEDANGDLWLATKGGGLARWERETDQFFVFRHDPQNHASLSSDSVRTVLVDSNGIVWAGTRGAGLNRFNAASGDFVRFHSDEQNPAAISHDVIYDITEDRTGNLWVATGGGLNVMNVATGQFLHYRHNPDDETSLSDDVVKNVFQDSAGTIWVGTFEGGLNRFESADERFVRLRFDENDSRSLSHDYVWAIEEDDENRLWIGTQEGLNLLDRASNSFTRFKKSPTDPASLGSSYVMSLHTDASGLLWVGTRGAGISQWNPRSWSFGHFKNDRLKDANVVAFAADNNGGVWIAALGAGLGRLDRATGDFSSLDKFLREGQALSDSRAMSLLLDRNEHLWVGTMTGGLNRIDLEAGTVQTWQHDPANASSLSANGVMSLHEDAAGTIWVGTFGGGLERFDPRTDSFAHFTHDPNDPNSLTSPRATALAHDSEGRIWVGTDDAGLNLVDPVTGQITRFVSDENDPSSLSSNGIYSLHTDRQGRMWIGTTDSGLDRVLGSSDDPASIRFSNLNQSDGLASNVAYGVVSDLSGQIWVSGNSGLTRIDPDTFAMRSFHRRHGLQGEEFNFGAHHRGRDGSLYFGGANGVNAFDPRALDIVSEAPNIVLTSFEKFNEPATLDQPYERIARVHLGYDDDVVTFEFAALDFVAPEKNLYRYMLEGFDRAWVEQSNRRRVTYTNLAAGDYVFRVSAANSDGVWNENGLAIPVRVDAAPWETPQAYSLYVLGVLLVIGGIFGWQHRRLIAAARIRQLAYYDALSGLPNVKLFRHRLADTLVDAKESKDSLAVLYVDLDRFKRINDTLGHTVGDRVIKSVAGRLSQCVHRRGDGVGQFELARLSGDQFLIFLRHRHAHREARELAKDIAQELAQPFSNGGQELVVTASIGAAIYPDHGEDAEELLKAADVAVTQAKQAGRRSFSMYSRKMSARALQRLSLEHEIRIALEQNQFQLYYQPKYRAGDLKIIGAEALLRWFHPTRGEISPGNFISVAEEAGQISELSRWVVGAACSQMRAWEDAGMPVVPIAVNLSPEDFLRDDPVDMVKSAMASTGVLASNLNLEITESALMHDTSKVSASLRLLKELGCGLSVDDFGTGYSSLAYLKRFPLDTLKIDRSFVSDISTDSDDAAICSAIIAMGRALGLKVVAEGVETDEQLRRLRADGCDQFQGFLLSRPVPADLFIELLMAQSPMQDAAREAEQKIVQLIQR